MPQIQFIQVTPEQLQNAIIEGVKNQLKELKEHFEPKTPNQYLTRVEVSKMLSVHLSTIHNWRKRKILQPKQIGGRIFYLRSEFKNAYLALQQ